MLKRQFKMKIIVEAQNQCKQGLTHCTSPVVVYGGLFGRRYVFKEDLFTKVSIDNIDYYLLKNGYSISSSWYGDIILSKLYKYNSIYMNFYFRDNDIPKRCEEALSNLITKLTNRLKETRVRVSKGKVRVTTRHLLKHISRLIHHKKYAITYTSQKENWVISGNISHTYMQELLLLLQEEGNVKIFKGYIDSNDKSISSMLLFTPNFIDYCNSNKVVVNVMEECLRAPLPKLVTIRDDNKEIVTPKKEEIAPMGDAEKILKAYNNELEKRSIMVNGIMVPEIFFRRIHKNDMKHGGRFYDNGQIQGEDQTSRSSILIDGCDTVELDYSGLHYSCACEELGLDLKGKDPYDFEFDIPVDLGAIESWRDKYGFTEKYDPVRNLKKSALLVMFNASSVRSAKAGISDNIFKDYKKEEPVKRKFVGISNIQVSLLVDKLLTNNKELASYMLSGVGLRFQKLDSDMIEYCIKGLMEIGEVGLPVHDSIIVKSTLKGFTINLMEDAYEHVMGSKVNCKIK